MAVVENAKVTSKGQVTIPAGVRDALKLRKGDLLTFEVGDNGQMTVRPVREKGVFARYVGVLADGSGKTSETITAELKRECGW